MKNKYKKGYTLVEVLVAVAVFGMLILPISKIIESNINVNKSSREELELASVLSYAYEAFLENNSLKESSYPNDNRYTIHYNVEEINNEISSKDIDLILDENNIKINSIYSIPVGQNMDFKIRITYNNNKANYDITYNSISSGEINIPIENPNFIIYANMMKKDEDKSLNILIDGVYENEIYSNKTIKLYKKIKEGEYNFNIVSIYPNLIEKTVDEKKFINKKVIITIKKDGKKLKESIYTFSVND
ncbi:prepilin-type N-terminal cleavage/methylation domain-containing protein [Caloramator sp. E03]|uniref:prepilin-type N-terminal cleavage/methylation domain-containing protein n=1 Tax=Caloramator sp. E03 TaxID=2576307 RepID=UPI00143CFFE0|nr:prepilin-type N-terminal cleavage/methylation domain-containing protein [Caloramator sp. E03]